jgi:hypothetical protein
LRWGDKVVSEIIKVSMTEYVDAIHEVLDRRSKTQRGQDSEDPAAEAEFWKLAPPEWNIYLDQFYVEMLPYRIKGFNGVVKTARHFKGRAGLITLGSLLVAMESNDFILRTASNWSRLYDVLRKCIVNPRCNNCTAMMDLNSVYGLVKTNTTNTTKTKA